MDYRTRGILALPIVAIVFASPLDATLRKCRTAATVPGTVVMVDGVAVREYDAGEPIGDEAMPARADIARIEIVCLTMTEGKAKGRSREVISILTFSGLPRIAKSHLADLVEAQATYFARNGEYSGSVWSLGFFASRIPIPIEMTVSKTGWAATVHAEDLRVRCQVAVGSGHPLVGDQKPGIPLCVAESAAAVNATPTVIPAKTGIQSAEHA